MWPFERPREKRPVVVFHVDQNGLAKGAYFRGDADVLIIDERDPSNRVYRMGQETPDAELRRKIGKHPLGGLLADTGQEDEERAPSALLGGLMWRWPELQRPGWANLQTARKMLKSAREALPFKAKSRAGA